MKATAKRVGMFGVLPLLVTAAVLAVGVGLPAVGQAQAPATADTERETLLEEEALQKGAPAEEAEPAASARGTADIENPYGMQAAWAQGDWVTRGTFIALLVMSAATWYVLFVKLWEQQRMFRQAREVNDEFWRSASVTDGIGRLKEGSPYWYVADRGLSASEHHEGTLVERVALSEWVAMSVNRAVNEIGGRLQSGLSVLATVGSTAPFVGLFGTVWGIYHALTAIGVSGQASIDKVAGPVGEALIMTALGLLVAVPAVMAYNWLVRRNKIAMDTVRAFGSDLHSVLLSGSRVGEVKKKDGPRQTAGKEA